MGARHKSGLSAKDFEDALVLALGRAVSYVSYNGVPFKTLFEPVMVIKGISSIDQYGFQYPEKKSRPFVAKWISWAFRGLKEDKGSRRALTVQVDRGLWGLTESGVRRALELQKEADDTIETEVPEVKETTVEAESVLDEILKKTATVELVHVPVVEPVAEPVVLTFPTEEYGVGMMMEVADLGVAPYHADPYIVGLAIEGATCFGLHSKRSSKCESCSLQVSCITDVRSKVREAAQSFHEALLLEAARKSRLEKSGGDLSTMLDDALKAKVGHREPEWDEQDKLASPITSPAEAVCYRCQGAIKAQERCQWVRGIGMYHLTC
jgi:hypothetical protein